MQTYMHGPCAQEALVPCPTSHNKLVAGLVGVTNFHQLPPAQQPPDRRPGPGELTAVQRADSPILAPLQPPASASIP